MAAVHCSGGRESFIILTSARNKLKKKKTVLLNQLPIKKKRTGRNSLNKSVKQDKTVGPEGQEFKRLFCLKF